MAQRIGGARHGTRNIMKKRQSERGKINITRYLQKFAVGDSVQLLSDPSVHEGLYHLDYYSKQGIVAGMQGTCYKVTITDGKKKKCIIVHPAHLKRIKFK